MEIIKLIPYLKKYKLKLMFGLIFIGISDYLFILVPRFVGKAIDVIALQQFPLNQIYWQIFWILLLTSLGGVFMFLTRRNIIVVSRLVEFDLRRDFLRLISNKPFSFFTERNTGELMALVTNDISAAREFIGPAVMYSVSTVITFIFALYFMFTLDSKMTFFSIIPLPFVTLTTYLLGKKIHSLFKDVQKQFSVLTTEAQEVFSGIRLVKSYAKENYEDLRFKELSEDYRQKNIKLELYNSLMVPLLLVLIGFSQLIVLSYGGFRVMNGTMTIGMLSQFFIYLNILIWPVAALGWVTNITERASASINRLWEILGKEPDDKSFLNLVKTDRSINITGEIAFDDVWFNYNNSSDWVLKNISFKVNAGETLGITGVVGSGKSTLVKLISKTYLPNHGKIFICGYNITQISNDLLYSIVSIVPQEPFLFSTTIADNISFCGDKFNEDEIMFFASIAGLEQDLKSFPNGLRTIVGERGVTLSGGQKQRVAIARALYAKPQILVLDDAFSAIDVNTEKKILSNIYSNFSSLTMIIISNRITSIMNSNKIIVLDKGKIIEEGTHDALIFMGGKYSALYELQKIEEKVD
ncbi:MAG: ABC transporter ATP-binding protein [Candidatus Kapaibacteriales bacterium]